jgi:hypothetical protein
METAPRQRGSAPNRERHDALIALVEQCLREGFEPSVNRTRGLGTRTAVMEAASRLKPPISYQAMAGNLERAKQYFGIEPDWSHFQQARYQQPVAKLHLSPAPPPINRADDGEPIRVLVIPDRHNDPRHPHRLEVTKWIARFGSEIRTPYVIDLGDSVTMDSCSRYDRNDTLKGRGKPPIKADLDNHLAMLQAFETNRASDWKPRLYRTRGNHEQRLFDFENMHPEDEGTHTHRYAQDLLQFGWKERGFGEIMYVSGVGFTHAPFNGMGKAMGGKTATHRAGALLCESLVHGHTHSFEIHNAAKLGPTDRVTVIQAGCALPEGEVEHYATHNPTGWSYGVLDLTVLNGAIHDLSFVTMRTLRARYSDDGADVRAA